MASSKAKVGTPSIPDPKLYSHLSQKERMMGGWPYSPTDPELAEGRDRARLLFRQFNNSTWDDVEGRRNIINKLLHPTCKNVKNIFFEPPFRVDYGYNVIVGEGFYANFDCVILDECLVEIGKNCALAPGVHIYTGTHPLNPKYRSLDGPHYLETAAPIKIGDQCWIGGKSIICPGVTIGDNVVVGAGSVVTKDIPSNVVVAGNPAKIIRYLDGAKLPVGL